MRFSCWPPKAKRVVYGENASEGRLIGSADAEERNFVSESELMDAKNYLAGFPATLKFGC